MFRLNTAEAKAFAKKLEKIGKSALGKATARTLTELATRANARQKINLDKRLIVRTPYTEKSLKMYPASETKSIASQNSVVGSVSPYLVEHDKGGIVHARKRYTPYYPKALRGASGRKKISPGHRIDKMNDFGDKGKFFVLAKNKSGKPRRRGGKVIPYTLKTPTVFYRKGKKLIPVRRFISRNVKVKATRWHTDAARADATTSKISAIFARKARIIEQELGAK